jgi:hypothetical protein
VSLDIRCWMLAEDPQGRLVPRPSRYFKLANRHSLRLASDHAIIVLLPETVIAFSISPSSNSLASASWSLRLSTSSSVLRDRGFRISNRSIANNARFRTTKEIKRHNVSSCGNRCFQPSGPAKSASQALRSSGKHGNSPRMAQTLGFMPPKVIGRPKGIGKTTRW